jgi:hypothetical protein
MVKVGGGERYIIERIDKKLAPKRPTIQSSEGLW